MCLSRYLFTIGYGAWKDTRRRMNGMIAQLQQANVNLLIDTRHSPCASDPSDRSNYGARDWHLQPSGGIVAALAENGIDYRWIVELGNPQKRDPKMEILRWQLETGDECWPVTRGLQLLASLVRPEQHTCCLLCACADHRTCHRLVIAEALVQQHLDTNWTIVNLPAVMA